MTFDTVHRYSTNTFTGIPIARLHKDIWYWLDYQSARSFAQAFDLPGDRIISYGRGWAIQMEVSGSYVKAPSLAFAQAHKALSVVTKAEGS